MDSGNSMNEPIWARNDVQSAAKTLAKNEHAQSLVKNEIQKELLIYGGDNRVYTSDIIEKFREMRKAGIQMREMVCEGNTYLLGPEEEYRWIPKKRFKNFNTIVYGDNVCLDFRGWAGILIVNKDWAFTERNKFEMLWEAGLPIRGFSSADTRY